MPKIKLTFDKATGETRVQAEGFNGPSCDKATEFLKALGMVTDYQKTADWYKVNLEISGGVDSGYCG